MTFSDNMLIHCVWEHNGDDSLIYSSNVVGAFTRGALKKMPKEIESYFLWAGELPSFLIKTVITRHFIIAFICLTFSMAYDTYLM
ncbi:MAG: hypothetical protein GX337_08380 [Christensenellaceae bacterium]|nr:hypothetical protein [Christensenellaceae bacterium]